MYHWPIHIIRSSLKKIQSQVSLILEDQEGVSLLKVLNQVSDMTATNTVGPKGINIRLTQYYYRKAPLKKITSLACQTEKSSINLTKIMIHRQIQKHTLLNQGSWRISRLRLWTIIGREPSTVVKALRSRAIVLCFRRLKRDEDNLIW